MLRLNGEPAALYRQRLSKRLAALVVLERALVAEIEAAAEAVRSSRDACREAEVSFFCVFFLCIVGEAGRGM